MQILTTAKPRLQLAPGILKRLHQHAQKTYPEECCGILIGKWEAGAPRIFTLRAAKNVHPGPRTRRFLLSPLAFLAAEREAAERGQEILGFYHSHPDRPALPSAEDRRQAWPQTVMMIVQVESGRPTDCRAFFFPAASVELHELEIVQIES